MKEPGEAEFPSCRSKGPHDELIERTYDYVIACQRKIKNVEVAEDFESRPHKAVTFQVENENIQEVRELKMPKALPGYSGG